MKKSPEMKQQLSAIDKLGFTLKELTAEEVTQLSPTADDGALVVERVAPEGPAALAGIEPGDLIRRIGSRATHTLDEATAAIDAPREGPSVPVLVEREGRAQFILIRPMAEAPANRSRSRN
jgi:serine protease Do